MTPPSFLSHDATMLDDIAHQLVESADVHQRMVQACSNDIMQAAIRIAQSITSGGKLMLCGNGGSAADSQHMAAELVGRLSQAYQRPPIAALALTTDTSFITAFVNDVCFEEVFARQIEALGKPNDVLFAISTSGNSVNIQHAVARARELSITTVGLLGNDGGTLKPAVDYAIVVPSTNTQRIQESMLTIEHIVCHLVERMVFGAEQHKKKHMQK